MSDPTPPTNAASFGQCDAAAGPSFAVTDALRALVGALQAENAELRAALTEATTRLVDIQGAIAAHQPDYSQDR